jgi:predicted nucleic acid-binding protein
MLHRQVAWEAGRIERELAEDGARLGENDNWIAATARTWGLRLVSRDAAFTRVPRLGVVSY